MKDVDPYSVRVRSGPKLGDILYYVYFDKYTKRYEILQTREKGLLGTYTEDDSYIFAGFTRISDASGYVQVENQKLGRG